MALLSTGRWYILLLRMRSTSFRKASRVVAWLFLAWVTVDLGFPSVCALDQEGRLIPLSVQSAVGAATSGDTVPAPPAHIDDCFCCSHCVNVTAIAGPPVIEWIDLHVTLPADRVPYPRGYPSYHPPRA